MKSMRGESPVAVHQHPGLAGTDADIATATPLGKICRHSWSHLDQRIIEC